MDFGLIGALPQRIYGIMTNEVLLAIPLFVFMGVMLERSRIAEDLLEAMGRLFGSLTGGLGISVALVGTLLAAAKGVVGATTVTMGLITLPTMLRHGYDKRLAAGTVAATATLAQIMPPATVLVVLGDQLNNSYQSAQLAKGTFAPNSLSLGDLFAGAIIPALMLVGLYLLYLIAIAIWRPHLSPAIAPDGSARKGRALVRELSEALFAPVLLIVAVLGSILGGLATPTESAAIGAFGALLLTARKINRAGSWPILACALALVLILILRALHIEQSGRAIMGALAAVVAAGALFAADRVWRAGILTSVMTKTTQISAMIFTILIGATLFSLVFRGLGGDDLVHRGLGDLSGGPGAAILIVMVALFLLGFVMDVFEIVFVVVPIVAPVLLALPGISPVWLGIMIAINLQTSFMHPPLGPTLFYLRGVAPREISTMDIYLGIVPFVLIQLLALVLLWFVPSLATWLPSALYGH
jgi:TRAP-type mannitol/chloroaromatic compound transport system permease large subunit